MTELRLAGVLIALCVCVVLPARAAMLMVGPGQVYASLPAAAAAAHDGDTIVLPAGRFQDCAVLKAANLTVKGAGPDKTEITTKTCEGKAILVADGDNLTVADLALTNAHVHEYNGAGIRAEGGNLTVRNVRFEDNEDGILSAVLPGKTITVTGSRFIHNGSCDGPGCAHGIYAGALGLLHVENSSFIGTQHGHHIKSRAARTEVVGCHFKDGPDGTASYAVEIPNGGNVLLRGNTFEKGPRAENHTAVVAIGSEGVNQPTSSILADGNDVTVTGEYNAVFVYNLTATDAVLTNNRLHGNVKPLRGDGSVR